MRTKFFLSISVAFSLPILAIYQVFADPMYGETRPRVEERGALVRVVSKWDADCDGNTIRSWDNMVDNWYDNITDDGEHGDRAWWKDGFYHNGNIVDSDFTDPSIVAWGRDDEDDHVDEADAILVALHGGVGTGNRWNACVRVNEPGTGNCVAWQGHMRFGDADLEFLHMSSCHSMNENVWWSQWQSSFHGLHQADGFHGISYVARTYANRYEDFADDGFDSSIAESWIDHLYKNRPGDRDMCPVARVHGFGSTEAEARIGNERYDWVFTDPDPDGGTAAVIFISGCDPAGQPALPGGDGYDYHTF